MRSFYQLIIESHPRDFRVRFGDEMMSIFEEQQRSQSTAELIVDGLLSLIRHWLRDQVSWSFVIAILVAGMQVRWILGGLFRLIGSRQDNVKTPQTFEEAILTVVLLGAFFGGAIAIALRALNSIAASSNRGLPSRVSPDAVPAKDEEMTK